jgi:hypothetical protein
MTELFRSNVPLFHAIIWRFRKMAKTIRSFVDAGTKFRFYDSCVCERYVVCNVSLL